MSRLNRSEAVRQAIDNNMSGTLAELQRRLSLGMINPEPPEVMVGETVFCTFRNFDPRSYGLYMWVAVMAVDLGIGVSRTRTYQFNVEGEGPITVDAKYVWTKEQVQRLTDHPLPAPYIPSFKDNFVLPDGVTVKDPEGVIQAVLNLLRDAEIRGRAGCTNVAAVRCDVTGLTLGHFYALNDALGQDVYDAITAVKKM